MEAKSSLAGRAGDLPRLGKKEKEGRDQLEAILEEVGMLHRQELNATGQREEIFPKQSCEVVMSWMY